MIEDELQRRTAEALERSGLADPRPLYRKLLVRLKQRDVRAYQEATRRYQEELEPALAAGEAEPIAAWLAYGGWLASRLAPGRMMAIDRSGRALPVDCGSAPAAGSMILHIPEDDRAPALVLAVPDEPSEFQRASAELLVR